MQTVSKTRRHQFVDDCLFFEMNVPEVSQLQKKEPKKVKKIKESPSIKVAGLPYVQHNPDIIQEIDNQFGI